MKTALLALAVLLLWSLPGSLVAQDVGETITVTGCLASQDDDDGTEYVLQNVQDSSADEIELMADAGVDFGPHVGHTVELTGVVVADEDEDDDENEVQLRVSTMSHVAASCGGG